MMAMGIDVADECLDEWCQGTPTYCCCADILSRRLHVAVREVYGSCHGISQTWYNVRESCSNHYDEYADRCFRWISSAMIPCYIDVLYSCIYFITRSQCICGGGVSNRWWDVGNMLATSGSVWDPISSLWISMIIMNVIIYDVWLRWHVAVVETVHRSDHMGL